jgi:microcin C transport system permease protein
MNSYFCFSGKKMFQYFLRRLLLAIPTFFGCTIIVFFVVNLAPGGPYEQQVQALKSGSGFGVGAESSAASNNGSATIPPTALAELKRYYGFDKPVYIRYMIWLGIWPRETDSYNVTLGTPRNVGEGKFVVVSEQNGKYSVLDESSKQSVSDIWYVENAVLDTLGTKQLRVFRTELSGILTGNFGNSYEYREPVIDLITARIPISLQFGVIGLVLSYVICIYLGIKKALNHGSTFDIVSSSIVLISYSIPGWALGLLLLVLLGGGSFFDVFPLGGLQSSDYSSYTLIEKILDRSYHFVLPVISSTISSFAGITLMMKNSLLDNLSQDYIRTAFAKGMREERIIWLHAMKNSIIPIASNIGHIIGIAFIGSFFIETTFNIEGIGKLSYYAILSRDYTVVFAFTVIGVIVNLLGNMLSDIILALVDPRIRFR